MAPTYRAALVTDIPVLEDIRNSVVENALVSVRLGHADYVAALTVDGRGWVCEDEGRIVGFVCGRPGRGDIWALFLRASHEGRGIGDALMAIVERWLFEQGLERIALTTAPGTRAERLYRRRGWRSLGLTASGELGFELARPAPTR